MPSKTGRSPRLMTVVMLAVAIWGVLLATGAWLYGYDPATGEVRFAPHALRGGIVLACVCTFLGIWGLLLWRRFK